MLAFLNQHFVTMLDLDIAEMIDRGQVWRLVHLHFRPALARPAGAQLSADLGRGRSVVPLVHWRTVSRRAWGAFRLTLYFLVGMIGTTVAAFLFDASFSNPMLAASLFFAFAWFYPDEVIYVFFILPMKIKWLAWISAGFLLLGFVTGTNVLPDGAHRGASLTISSSLDRIFSIRCAIARKSPRAASVSKSRSRSDAEPLHRCATCGATELSDPNLEFRVSRDGEEYCMAHLPARPRARADSLRSALPLDPSALAPTLRRA